MPLTPEQIERFKQMSARTNQIAETSSQGIDFKPRIGPITVALEEIPGAANIMWVEYAEHSYPDNKGATICARSLGKDHCLLCELLEYWQDSQDDYLQKLLSEISVGKTKYAMKIYYQSKDTGNWVGPFRWRMREDQFLKFAAYFRDVAKYGLPTDGTYDIMMVARKRQYRGKDVLDISSCIKDSNTHMVKDSKGHKDLDILKLCSPRSDEDILEKLEDTSLGPYLRNIDLSTLQQEAQEEPKVTPQAPAPAQAPPAPQVASPAAQEDDPGEPPPCYLDEWIEGDETCVTCPFQGPCSDAVKAKSAPPPPPPEVQKPKFMGKAGRKPAEATPPVEAPAPPVQVVTPPQPPAPPAPPATPPTASHSPNSPLQRAKAVMNKGKS